MQLVQISLDTHHDIFLLSTRPDCAKLTCCCTNRSLHTYNINQIQLNAYSDIEQSICRNLFESLLTEVLFGLGKVCVYGCPHVQPNPIANAQPDQCTKLVLI